MGVCWVDVGLESGWGSCEVEVERFEALVAGEAMVVSCLESGRRI